MKKLLILFVLLLVSCKSQVVIPDKEHIYIWTRLDGTTETIEYDNCYLRVEAYSKPYMFCYSGDLIQPTKTFSTIDVMSIEQIE